MAQHLTHEHLQLFANKRRAEIIEILLEGEISVGELGRRLNLGQSALSQHLAKMRAAGVVDTRRDRQIIFYSSDFEPARQLLALLRPAPVQPDERARLLIEEGLDILANLTESITKHGNYSPESTCTFIDQAGRMTCPMPADETVVEVMLQDGTVCRAWYSCNIMDAGDWDFMPVTSDDEPDDEADSIASKVVAWRALSQPHPADERVVEALPYAWANVRVEDTGDGLIIHPDDARKWGLDNDRDYTGSFLPDGRFRIALAQEGRKNG